MIASIIVAKMTVIQPTYQRNEKVKKMTAVCLSMILGGCVTHQQSGPAQVPVAPSSPDPTLQELQSADYGQYPNNYEQLVKQWTESSLKDPNSAIINKISKPRKEYIFQNRAPVFGYSICALVNAKNSYGGYTGNQVYWIFINNGKVLRYQNTQEKIGGFLPGTLISVNHYVSCDDGDK
ncbi:TPA: hypothetical protein ACKP0L_004543 [Pseudomonas putida]